MEIHVGCSGWFYWHWRGVFYPQEGSTRDWFRHYTTVFDTVELNAPFYKWPRPATVKGWKRNAPPGFRYTVKVNGEITHERRMVRTQQLVKSFYQIGEELGPQFGCFLFQFPPSYKYSPARLKNLLRQLDPAWRNVVEFRHKSWWRSSVYRALAGEDITFCAVSAPRLPEELPGFGKPRRERPDRLYVRFHGRTRWYRHDYSGEELTAWARRIALSGAKDVWIYFNNDREGFAIKNALELRELLRDLVGESNRGHLESTPVHSPRTQSRRPLHATASSKLSGRAAVAPALQPIPGRRKGRRMPRIAQTRRR